MTTPPALTTTWCSVATIGGDGLLRVLLGPGSSRLGVDQRGPLHYGVIRESARGVPPGVYPRTPGEVDADRGLLLCTSLLVTSREGQPLDCGVP